MAEFPGVDPRSLMDADQRQRGVGDAIAILRSVAGLEPITNTVSIPLIS